MKIVIKSKAEEPHVLVNGDRFSLEEFEKVKHRYANLLAREPLPPAPPKPKLIQRIKNMFMAFCARLAKLVNFTGFFK